MQSTCNKFQEQNKFQDEKTNIEVSRREKSTCNKFHEQKQETTSSTTAKTQLATIPWIKSVSRREKSMYKFQE